jgi:alkanesulfonate monooxygenase SsuD/methylene tetrahydromethanopterin reductase-like flavin-dependent oxidoreductase (luciferase family)
MKYGFFMPNFGPFGDARCVGDLAGRAEAAGWDGFFVWDHMLFSPTQVYDIADPWVALAAAAMTTERIRLGAVLTPLARRRPWKVARETVTLDHLSGGRLIFAAGLGFPPDAEFQLFGEVWQDRDRARMLDAGLQVLTGLWSGEEFQFSGEDYQVGPVTFRPRPVQQPRIPVWVGGWWPNKPPYRRAAKWDGLTAEMADGSLPRVTDVAEMTAYIAQFRDPRMPLDVAINGHDSWSRQHEMAAYAEAGLTWFLERVDPDRAFSVAEATALIDKGPPA